MDATEYRAIVSTWYNGFRSWSLASSSDAGDTWREVTVTNEVAARFDLELDRRLDIVARALEKLDHKRMIAEAETMIQMLRHGLVDAADFAR